MSSTDPASTSSVSLQEQKLVVVSATNISKKVTQCLAHLFARSVEETKSRSPPQLQNDENPITNSPIVQIWAKSANACKAITIAEIAKRRMDEQGLRWYQYNAIDSIEEEISRKQSKANMKKRKRGGKAKEQPEVKKRKKVELAESGETDSGKSEDDPFERLPTPTPEAPPKKKTVPILKIYLSRIKLEEYAKIYRLVSPHSKSPEMLLLMLSSEQCSAS